jgi:hypothetical protein
MLACLSPPISAIFVMGAFWARGTHQAAFITLVSGFCIGTFTFYTDFTMQLFTSNGVPFLMQAWWQFVISCLVFVGVSLKTPEPAARQVKGLCLDLIPCPSKRIGIADPHDPSIPGIADPSDGPHPPAAAPKDYSDWNGGGGGGGGRGLPKFLPNALAAVLCAVMCGLLFVMR